MKKIIKESNMQVVCRIDDVKSIVKSQKMKQCTVGLVPTMGYLHDGHISLINKSVSDNDFTVLSIFINPTQFGENEDYDEYPRDWERDKRIADESGVDVIFIPSINEMYPQGYKTYVNVSLITEILCGKSRTDHFKGVTTIVNKLFNIVEPDRVYFGQKDAQQAAVIKKMISDLNINVEMITCPIVRENDGLAMSSRNVNLNAEHRKAAVVLSKALFEAERMINAGQTNKQKVIKHIDEMIKKTGKAEIDYVEALDADTLQQIELIKGKVLIALAVKFGKTRLIDNIIVEV